MADLDSRYLELESGLEATQKRCFDLNEKLKADVRKDPDLDEIGRLDRYREAYQGLEQEMNRAVNTFVGAVEDERTQLEAKIYEGHGPHFAGHLTSLASVSDETLRATFNTAQRTHQPQLAQAAAMVAHERGLRGIVDDWTQADPQRAEAMRRLHSLPDERPSTRCLIGRSVVGSDRRRGVRT